MPEKMIKTRMMKMLRHKIFRVSYMILIRWIGDRYEGVD